MNNKQIIKLLKSIHTKNNSLPILDNILLVPVIYLIINF